MCTFVLGTLPAHAPLERLRRGFFSFREVRPGAVARLLLPGESFGRMTHSYCDCDAPLAIADSRERMAHGKDLRIEHKLERIRRKGWSPNRIERWLSQVEADRDRQIEHVDDGAATDTREWRDWLRHAFEEVGIDYVGLLVDDFSGRLDDVYGTVEKPTPAVREAWWKDVDEVFLQNLERGVLYRIRR